MTDAVGSIDMPDAQEQKPRKGGKRAKKGPLKRLALFYRQIIAELRKVVWPTRNQLTSYTTAVIVFVVLMIGLITLIGTIGAKVETMFGGHISMLTTLCERARADAFDILLAHAQRRGANAVVGVRYDATEIMSGVTEVICYGTAVVVERRVAP